MVFSLCYRLISLEDQTTPPETIKMLPICLILITLCHLTSPPSDTLAGVTKVSPMGIFSPSAHHTDRVFTGTVLSEVRCPTLQSASVSRCPRTRRQTGEIGAAKCDKTQIKI